MNEADLEGHDAAVHETHTHTHTHTNAVHQTVVAMPRDKNSPEVSALVYLLHTVTI